MAFTIVNQSTEPGLEFKCYILQALASLQKEELEKCRAYITKQMPRYRLCLKKPAF